MLTEEAIRDALRAVIDPEIGLDIITLGMVYEVSSNAEGKVWVEMTLTSRGCPLGPHIINGVQSAVKTLEGVTDVEVELVWEPAWSPDLIDPAARKALMGH